MAIFEFEPGAARTDRDHRHEWHEINSVSGRWVLSFCRYCGMVSPGTPGIRPALTQLEMDNLIPSLNAQGDTVLGASYPVYWSRN